MILVTDKIFYPQTLEKIDSTCPHAFFTNEDSHTHKDVCTRLLTNASAYFNFNNQIGYDVWFHRNGTPGWHQPTCALLQRRGAQHQR